MTGANGGSLGFQPAQAERVTPAADFGG